MKAKPPIRIALADDRKTVELTYSPAEIFNLSAEFLRVHSPSAEVRGHGNQNAVLQVGKRDVRINDISTAGNYAIKFTFDDGHDSGLYTWEYLHQLSHEKDELWENYLNKLDASGKSRDPS